MIQPDEVSMRAFKMGEEAFKRGAELVDCPLRSEHLVAMWDCGWISAQTEAKKRPSPDRRETL